MKKLSFYTLLFCLAAICALNLHSCQEFDIDSQAEFPLTIDIDAQPEYTVMAESPNAIVFNISANTPWKVESNKNWCIPTPAMSAASSLISEVSVKIEEYTDEAASRTATLTITAEGVEGSKTVTITQLAKGALYVTNFAEDLPSEGGSARFSVTANNAWKIINPEEWLTLDIEEGTGTGEKVTITATALPNTGLKRTAKLTIVSNGKEQEVVATQKGITLEFGEIAEEYLTFDGGTDKESKTYPVVSNIEWEASSDADWLKVETDENGNVVATSLSEIYFTNRTATITLTAKDKTLGVEGSTLEVQQTGGEYYLAPENSDASVDEETGALTLNETTGNARSRYSINKTRRLAIHEWTFSNIEVEDNRGININCVGASTSVPNWNFWLGKSGNSWLFKYRNPIADSYCDPFDMNKLRALKISHDYSENDPTKIKVKVFIKLEGDTEWTTIINTNDFANFSDTDPGYPLTFGFIEGSPGKRGTMTITSYEVTNIE